MLGAHFSQHRLKRSLVMWLFTTVTEVLRFEGHGLTSRLHRGNPEHRMEQPERQQSAGSYRVGGSNQVLLRHNLERRDIISYIESLET
jgi:hypothetical protein